jgi:hypothetical protein
LENRIRRPSGPTSGRAAQDVSSWCLSRQATAPSATATEQIFPVPQGISALETNQTRSPSGDQDGLIAWSCVE